MSTVTEFPAPMAYLEAFRVFRPKAADGRTFPAIAMTLVDPKTGKRMVVDLAMGDDQA